MRVLLENVPEEYVFYVADGSILRNLSDLEKCLATMEDTVFHHHVHQRKNDFHNWLRDIVLDLELAHKILKVKNQKEASVLVKKRMHELETFIKQMNIKKMHIKKVTKQKKEKKKKKQSKNKQKKK